VGAREFQLFGPATSPMKFAGTVSLYWGGAALVEFKSGRVYWDPPAGFSIQTFKLNAVVLNLCRADPLGNFTADKNYWVETIKGLDEDISKDREINLEGISVR